MTAGVTLPLPRKKPGRLVRLLRFLRSDLRAAVSLGYLALLLVVSLFAPWIAPYSPLAQDYSAVLVPPGPDHWLGTDDVGRDILSRLIHGARCGSSCATSSRTPFSR